MLRLLSNIFAPVPATHAFGTGGTTHMDLQLWDGVAGHGFGRRRLGSLQP
jgi:hypothetical protein